MAGADGGHHRPPVGDEGGPTEDISARHGQARLVTRAWAQQRQTASTSTILQNHHDFGFTCQSPCGLTITTIPTCQGTEPCGATLPPTILLTAGREEWLASRDWRSRDRGAADWGTFERGPRGLPQAQGAGPPLGCLLASGETWVRGEQVTRQVKEACPELQEVEGEKQGKIPKLY